MVTQDDGIQVVIGVADEQNGESMQFVQFDDGVKFAEQYTCTDLTICVAVLRDLADALEVKINMMTN